MASINPSVLNCANSPHVSGKKDNHIRLTITEITQTGGAENKTTVKWKLTVEGTPYSYLYAAYATLGGRVLYDHHTGGAIKTSWSAGDTIASGTETFNNNSDGSLTLHAYVKQMFYYGNGDTSRWTNPSYYQDASTDMVCSTIPRYATPYQSLNETGDNYLKINWGADVSCDQLQYSINGGASWVNVSGYPTYTITGLSPNTTYNVATRVRRTDSGLWSNTSSMSVTTLKSPYMSALSDFNIGSSFSCSLYNPKGRTLTLYLYANNVADVIVRTTNVNGTYTFVPTENENNSLYNTIPNAKNGKFKVAVVCSDLGSTNWSNSSVGDKTYYTVENDCKPTATINAVDVNSDTIALTGSNTKVIKYFSNVQATLTASAKKGASISSKSISCSDGKSGSGSPVLFQNVESGTFTGIATDTRGYPVSVSKTLTLVEYIRLTLNIDVYRVSPTSSSIVAKFNGNYFNNNFGQVDNTLSLKYRFKENTSGVWGSWINLNPVKSGNRYSNGSTPISLGSNFDYQKSYDFEFVALDKIYDGGEISSFTTVVGGESIFDWGKDDFNINGKLNLFETSIIRHIANILYPTGSIYVSLTQSIPEWLAGEWEFLNTIVSNGTTYYVYQRTNENERIYYNDELLLYNGEEIYIENTLLKGSDVL